MKLFRYFRLLAAGLILCLGWTSTAQAAISAAERQVLLDLYASTNGTNWIDNTNWGGVPGTECTWYGVWCNGPETNVAFINLASNNLVGTLPPISGLTVLQDFSAFFNQLTGPIPSLSGLTALQNFDVSLNQLTGPIPSLSGLAALENFYVYQNQLTGSIPSLGGLTSLRYFFASDNQLTGSIPSLGGLTALQVFYADGNQLTGSIPSLSELTALKGLGINNNHLTGPVPAAPTSLTANRSNLCGNGLVSSASTTVDAAWMAAQSTDITKGGVADGNWLACQTVASSSNFLLTVTRSGAGTGTITSNPGGIYCGIDCSESYTSSTSFTLTLTLFANPAKGSYFYGWGGACGGAGTCVVKMDNAKNVVAIFKPEPFVATTTVSFITETNATITTSIAFNPTDVGKTGEVYITAWTPVNSLGDLGILSAPTSHALNVTTTPDNPYSGGAINTRQETLAAILAAADPNVFVLIQLTSSGWQLVQNGQLIPYATGILGDAMSSLSILNNVNTSNFNGTQFCIGYGTSAGEMIASGRMMPVTGFGTFDITTNGSCNVAANPYNGLWYNVSESGWGMSVTQHDNINFVALYTYDPSAQPVWYVMSNCPIVTAGSCTGDIYKVAGGSVPTSPWAPNLALSTAGRGTLTFSDNNHGKFDFTLNGVTGSKTIERQLFSSGTVAQALDYTDLWWNAGESGWGVALTQDMGMIFAAWYTYDAAGQPVWYVASSCPLSGSGCTGDVYKVTGGTVPTSLWAPSLAVNPVGSVSFSFSDNSTGTMSYTINGVAVSRGITRQAF